jgi:hypothetical protein
LISDDALKHIFHRFKLIVETLILDGCHRITGKSLAVIGNSTLQNASFKWCDGLMDADMLSHLKTRGLLYKKIDLRGYHKVTGVPLFEECEQRAVDEGMLKPDAIFSRPTVFINIRCMFGLEPHIRPFQVSAHCIIQKVLAAWCQREGTEIEDLVFTCNGRLFHHSLCAAEMLVILNIKEPVLEVRVHATSAVGAADKLWSIASDAEVQYQDIYEPLMHPYSSGYEQARRAYFHTTHLEMERMFYDMES